MCLRVLFFYNFAETKNSKSMGKKKGGKRLGKKQVSELLQNLFQHNPNETFTFKQIFKALKLDTHP